MSEITLRIDGVFDGNKLVPRMLSASTGEVSLYRLIPTDDLVELLRVISAAIYVSNHLGLSDFDVHKMIDSWSDDVCRASAIAEAFLNYRPNDGQRDVRAEATFIDAIRDERSESCSTLDQEERIADQTFSLGDFSQPECQVSE